MELCRQCPMRDERYVPSNQIDKIQISNLKVSIERYRDFIGYLFDESEHCDHISESDAWKEFEEWEDKNNETPSLLTQ